MKEAVINWVVSILIHRAGFGLFCLFGFSLLIISLRVFGEPKKRMREYLGPDFSFHSKEVQAIHEKAESSIEQGNYVQALKLLEEALGITRKSSNANPRDVANISLSITEVYEEQGDSDKALSLLKQSLETSQKFLAADNPVVAWALIDIGQVNRALGRFDEAIASFEKSLSIWKKAQGEQSIGVALCLSNLALAYRDQGKYAKAFGLLTQALPIVKQVLGEDDPQFAQLLNNLAVVYEDLAHYNQALTLGERSVAIIEQALGKEAPAVAYSLNNLASIYRQQGKYKQSLSALKRSLAINERVFGMDHPRVAIGLNNLGKMHEDSGQPDQAWSAYERSLAIMVKAVGPEHPDLVPILDDTASLCSKDRDFVKAIQLLEWSLRIQEKAFGKEHPDVANTLNELASICRDQKDYKTALALFERSLAIKVKAHGADHPQVAKCLNDLGLLYVDLGDYRTASYLLNRSLSITEQVSGPDHFYVAIGLNNLATLYLEQKDHATALPLLQRSLAISEKALRSEHPVVIRIMFTLAEAHRVQGNARECMQIYPEIPRLLRRYLTARITGMPENVALIRSEIQFDMVELYHSLCFSGLVSDLPDSKSLVAEQLALAKAFTEELETTRAALEASPQTSTQELREQYQSIQVQLARLAESKLEPVERDARRRELQSQLRQLESKLAERVGLVAQTLRERDISLKDVARNLPSDSALVDFIHYQRYDFAGGTNRWKEQRYAGYLTFPLARDSTDLVVESVDLGEAAPINEVIKLISMRMAAGQYRAKDLSPALQRLSDLVYAPLAGHLTNVSRLIVCPDGELSRVPFEMLRDGDKFLVEEKTISYVTSGREVARIAAESKASTPAASPALVMGDPDFDLDLGSKRAPRTVADASSGQLTGSSRGDEALASKSEIENRQSKIDQSLLTSAATRSLSFRSLNFKRLPGTAGEARTVARLLGDEHALRLGAQARERELKAVRSPRVLHLATHGFFLSDQEFKPTSSVPDLSIADTRSARRSFVPAGSRWENPMLRCGIALAGANQAQQVTNAIAEDGLLTGLEASLLNLQGKELVILSACDTGSGEVKITEGVMSLRRAFRIAGAQSVLASHWKVSDKATSQLMAEFMRRWRAGEPRAKAWRESQLSLLHSKDFSSPYFWAAFTLTGKWR